jgi:pre-mRNA-splicing factor ISY1
MARNSEKAQFMLNRYLASKEEEARGDASHKPKRRPRFAQECTDLYEAESWRNRLLRDIGSKVMEIQNEGLGEHRLRELNDEINKLMRVKYHWERRIVELGGTDYAKVGLKIAGLSDEQSARPSAHPSAHPLGKGGSAYRYYGAAKQLPGVRELFEVKAVKKKKQTKGELMKKVDGDYYGFRDEDDGGALVREEAEAEAMIRAKKLEEQRRAWEAAGRGNASATSGDDPESRGFGGGSTGGPPYGGPDGVVGAEYEAYVPLPNAKDIEARIVESKKQRLLAAYGNAAENE